MVSGKKLASLLSPRGIGPDTSRGDAIIKGKADLIWTQSAQGRMRPKVAKFLVKSNKLSRKMR